MPQFERRLYEPSDDMRAFDASEDEFEEEGSRLPLLIVIALVVLASFAGVVWLAYSQGVQRGRDSAPRIIAAQPVQKTASAEKNPYAGLNIYKPSKPEDEQIDQDAAPPPLVTPKIHAPPAAGPAVKSIAPAIKPAIVPLATTARPAAAKPTVMAQKGNTPTPKVATQRGAPAKIPPQPPARVATAAPRTIAPPSTLKPTPKVAALVAKPAPRAPKLTSTERAKALPAVTPAVKSPPAVTPVVKPTTEMVAVNSPNAEKTTPAPENTAAEHAGGFLLQIGSYKSEAEASASWQTYKTAHPGVAGYASDIHRAELGAKGTWYRLRVGPFASLSEANAACARLKASGGNCFPAKR
ncbi:MAG TPA: SPOR domain-containing protein [Rhizomicrobium sp.]|jgi:cell division protein FtsN